MADNVVWESRAAWAQTEARPCAPGLICCYPCGIPGCDWQCMESGAGPDDPHCPVRP